jgi:hypothetical protein
VFYWIDGDSYYPKYNSDELFYKKVGWFVTGCHRIAQKTISTTP